MSSIPMISLGHVGKVSNYGVFWVSGLLVRVACRYVGTDAPEEQTASAFWTEAAGHIPPECPHTHTRLHGVISEKTKISAFIAVQTSPSTSSGDHFYIRTFQVLYTVPLSKHRIMTEHGAVEIYLQEFLMSVLD
jgi:hypothetical protein